MGVFTLRKLTGRPATWVLCVFLFNNTLTYTESSRSGILWAVGRTCASRLPPRAKAGKALRPDPPTSRADLPQSPRRKGLGQYLIVGASSQLRFRSLPASSSHSPDTRYLKDKDFVRAHLLGPTVHGAVYTPALTTEDVYRAKAFLKRKAGLGSRLSEETTIVSVSFPMEMR